MNEQGTVRPTDQPNQSIIIWTQIWQKEPTYKVAKCARFVSIFWLKEPTLTLMYVPPHLTEPQTV